MERLILGIGKSPRTDVVVPRRKEACDFLRLHEAIIGDDDDVDATRHEHLIHALDEEKLVADTFLTIRIGWVVENQRHVRRVHRSDVHDQCIGCDLATFRATLGVDLDQVGREVPLRSQVLHRLAFARTRVKAGDKHWRRRDEIGDARQNGFGCGIEPFRDDGLESCHVCSQKQNPAQGRRAFEREKCMIDTKGHENPNPLSRRLTKLSFAYDQMIEHFNAEELAGLNKVSSQRNIFRTRRRVARRVLMHDDDARTVGADRFAEQLGYPHHGGVETALVDGLDALHAIAGVEQNDAELFLLEEATSRSSRDWPRRRDS